MIAYPRLRTDQLLPSEARKTLGWDEEGQVGGSLIVVSADK